MATSVILLGIVVWMFHSSHPTPSKTSVTSSGVLELIWITAHSTALQDLMKTVGSSVPDQLRLRGMKAEFCLADLASEPTTCEEENNIQFEAYTLQWQRFSTQGLFYCIFPSILIKFQLAFLIGKFFTHCLCYALHIFFLALHMVLIVLLEYHPEHNVIMASDNPWVTTTLSVSLQAFYTVGSSLLLFHCRLVT